MGETNGNESINKDVPNTSDVIEDYLRVGSDNLSISVRKSQIDAYKMPLVNRLSTFMNPKASMKGAGKDHLDQLNAEKSKMGLGSHDHDECFIRQVYSIAIFYSLNLCIDISLFFLGKKVVEDQAVNCLDNTYIVVSDEEGAEVLLFQACTYLVYSFVMYHIFYRLPKRYGQISYKKRGVKEVEDIKHIRVSKSMAKEDKILDNFIEIDKQDRLFETNKLALRQSEQSSGLLGLEGV